MVPGQLVLVPGILLCPQMPGDVMYEIYSAALAITISEGQTDLALKLLDTGFPANGTPAANESSGFNYVSESSQQGCALNPLAYAIYYGNAKVVQKILSKGGYLDTIFNYSLVGSSQILCGGSQTRAKERRAYLSEYVNPKGQNLAELAKDAPNRIEILDILEGFVKKQK